MKKIVIVDNDKVSVEVLANIMIQEGYTAFKAYDGVEGLQTIRAHSPEIVILDLFMPGIDGIRLCRYLKQMPEFSGIKIIALSPLTLEETLDIMEHEADFYIAKGYITDVADNTFRSLRLLLQGKDQLPLEERAFGFAGRHPRVVVEELLAERKHNETIMHNVGDGIFEVDADNVVTYVNPAGIAMIEKDEMSIIGHDISDVLGKRYDGQFQETLHRLKTAKQMTSLEMPVMYGKYTFEMKFANILSYDQQYAGSLLIVQNVSHLTERIRELTLLNDVGRLLTSTLDFNEVLQILMRQIQKILGVEAISLLLVEKATKDLIFQVALGRSAHNLQQTKLKAGQGIVGWVAKKGKPLLIPDVSVDPRFDKSLDEATGFKTKSMICVPLKIRNEVIGVIQVINHGDDKPFTEDNLYLLSSISMYASIAIEHANLYQEVHGN
ncbi:GAF domain-containing protein [candidate division KSB3 bacterium]|jgi:CheY-like chemotaxis protein|uniref:GAF domain-containing protein n=1 Tax=candidate division KSB3 bacterium TaxID=2044937 RepID=A0A9D5JZN3_9BACT|nr:GAF domain-containing protein [candidate division KSB3 bacterium]MBD3327085.1 GAF domain-containing protein [candidate division KSB3 bacterium]